MDSDPTMGNDGGNQGFQGSQGTTETTTFEDQLNAALYENLDQG